MEDLRLQTTQVDTDWCRMTSDPMTLPSLRNLRLQSTHLVMQTILELLQPSTIEHLHLEAHGPALDVTAWSSIIDTLTVKASLSLRSLTIEHYPTDSTVDSSDHVVAESNSFTLLPFKALKACRGLRKFTIGTTSLINFTDRDIEEMSSWWPHLQYLDLGTLPVLNEDVPYHPMLSVKALHHLAHHCPNLRDLILSLDLSQSPNGDLKPPRTQLSLETLRVGHTSDATSTSEFIQTVLSIFPSIKAIECETNDGETSVVEPGRQPKDVNARVATEDGFANGQ